MSEKPSAAKLTRLMYLHGKIEGVRRYAHWTDGRAMVGTRGTTLKWAIGPYEKEAAALMIELCIDGDELVKLRGEA